MVSATLVIPTAGRDTLELALQSTLPELQNAPRDYFRVMVAIDTYEMPKPRLNAIEKLCTNYSAEFLHHNAHYHDWGYPQLEAAYRTICLSDPNSFIMNIGDDDMMLPGAFGRILDIVSVSPRRVQPYMFQAILHASPNRGIPAGESVILWNDLDRSIVRSKVTGQNLLCPANLERLGSWSDDFNFIKETIDLWNGRVKWVPVTVCECH